MNMPFTVDQFFAVFARYNDGVWPAQMLLNMLALGVAALVVRGRPSHGPWIAAVLALLWGWMAVAYHFVYFTTINPVAWFLALSHLSAPWGSRGLASLRNDWALRSTRDLMAGWGAHLLCLLSPSIRCSDT